MSLYWLDFQRALHESQSFLLIALTSIAANMLMLILFWERVFGYKGQGSRLRSLKNKRTYKKKILKFSLSFFMACLFWKFMTSYTTQSLLSYKGILTPETLRAITQFIAGSFTLSLSIVLYAIFSATWALKRAFKLGSGLPKKFWFKNHLTLGAVGEEPDAFDKLESPKWLAIPQKALNGNILITGSIGAGKTQGTILNFCDQLFNKDQFASQPGALVLDPKGTFIVKISEMLEKRGLTHRCLHLGDGENSLETFNPVYVKDPLKNSNYLDVASMIRAASKNFSGQSKESPIWENSAFNLTKNIVVYCAATLDYFTLRDCYKAMLIADSEEVIENLEKSLGSDKFDEEEQYNIQCAIEYFQEYALFEDKFKSGVLVTAITFLNQFQDYKASQIFCPRREKLTMTSMDNVVDQSQILLFNVSNEALARSMGTFIKLHYERSVLNRLKDPKRPRHCLAAIIADEYQDIVSVGGGGSIGDDKICAKGREANFFFLAASQSLNSIYNTIGNDKAAKELIQNFRTRIACHSSDVETIRNFKELIGQGEKEKTNHSVSECSQKTKRNFILGGFDSKDAHINESISTIQERDFLVTGQDFSRLQSFEAFAQVYDGLGTQFHKLFLKPYFLKQKNIKNKKILQRLRSEASKGLFILTLATLVKLATGVILPTPSMAFPNICDVINTEEFKSCLDFKATPDVCHFPPRPCVRLSYYVPQTFIEVSPRAGQSHFHKLPGASLQLSMVQSLPPFGMENDEDTQSYHARTLAVPFTEIFFNLLPCGGSRITKLCFDGMSEHISEHWSTGKGDRLQPSFLAGSLSPKACLLKGSCHLSHRDDSCSIYP